MIRLASVTGHAGVGQELVDNGADVDIEDEEGKTALMQATVNNHHELVKVSINKFSFEPTSNYNSGIIGRRCRSR